MVQISLSVVLRRFTLFNISKYGIQSLRVALSVRYSRCQDSVSHWNCGLLAISNHRRVVRRRVIENWWVRITAIYVRDIPLTCVAMQWRADSKQIRWMNGKCLQLKSCVVLLSSVLTKICILLSTQSLKLLHDWSSCCKQLLVWNILLALHRVLTRLRQRGGSWRWWIVWATLQRRLIKVIIVVFVSEVS